MSAVTSSMPKDQWVAAFVAAFRQHSRHILSERSTRVVALKQWEARSAMNPVEVARHWNSYAVRPGQ